MRKRCERNRKKGTGRRLLTLFLAGAMVLPTAASGNNETTNKEGDGNGEKPIDIRVFSSYNAAEENEGSKFVVEELEKALNINLIRDEVPSSAYQEKLQLAMSDNNYPDVFVFNSHQDTMLLDAIDNGLVISIDEYLEPGKYPNLEKYIYEGAWEAVKLKDDGKCYLIPRCTVSRVDGFAVRQDWLDKLGLKLSEDTTVMKDEFMNLVKAFCEDDPDGNGARDTYGLSYSPDSSGNLSTLCDGAFNCVGWQPSDGEYAYMDPMYELGNKDYKALLEYNQQLYQYAHPDSLVTDSDTLITSGQTGMKVSFAGHVSNVEHQLQDVNADAKCTYLAGVVNDEGVLQGEQAYPGIWGGLALTKDCKHPEKVLEMVDWLLSDQAWEYVLYGIPDVTYTKNADGTCTVIDAEVYRQKNLGGSWASIIARRKEDADFFIDRSLSKDEYDTIKEWLDTAIQAVRFAPNYGKEPDIATDTAFIEAENTRKETVTKIIMGVMSPDEYDAVLQKWYEKGGKTYIEQMNELIKKINQ